MTFTWPLLALYLSFFSFKRNVLTLWIVLGANNPIYVGKPSTLQPATILFLWENKTIHFHWQHHYGIAPFGWRDAPLIYFLIEGSGLAKYCLDINGCHIGQLSCMFRVNHFGRIEMSISFIFGLHNPPSSPDKSNDSYLTTTLETLLTTT